MAPLLIRLALAVTFIWAGWEKFFGEMPVKGDDAAILANLGILTVSPSAPAIPPGQAPAEPLASPRTARPAGVPGVGLISVLAQSGVPAAVPARTFTGSDFPDEVRVRRVWGLALAMHKGAHPDAAADGTQLRPIWPGFLAQGPFPRVLAIAVAVTELAGGVLVLVGWFTRLAGLGLAGVMLGALWLTQIGPNWQTGNVVYGILPVFDDPRAWSIPLWQMALLCMSLALAVGGSGRLAIDWALRGSLSTVVHARPAPATGDAAA